MGTPSANATPAVSTRVQLRRDPVLARKSRALYWKDVLHSLWAPLSVFGLAFLPYILLIELVPSTASWAQPALKGFGLLMLAWFVVLLVLRQLRPGEERLRRARRDARELLSEVRRRLVKQGATLGPDAFRTLEEGTLALEAQVVESHDVGAVEQGTRTLSDTAGRLLPRFRKGSTADFFGGFAKALLIALAIRTVLIEPYRIPSGSMLPTLQIGDQVFINKFIYGVRIPFTNTVPFVIVREPARGDVIVFENPVTGEDYIKRVVGVPGDRVEIREGTLFINGQAQPRTLVDASYTAVNRHQDSDEWYPQPSVAFQEQLGEHEFISLRARDPSRRLCAEEGPFLVPEGHVFVMGDNRDNSADSRYGLGRGGMSCDPEQAAYVPFGHIKGKAMVIWLALGFEGLGSNLFGGSGLRTDRLFLPVR